MAVALTLRAPSAKALVLTWVTEANLALAAEFPMLTGAMTATATASLTVAAAFPMMSGAMTVTASASASLAAAFPMMSGAMTATAYMPVDVAAEFPMLTGGMDATVTLPVSIAASFPMMSADMTVVTGDLVLATLGASFPMMQGAMKAYITALPTVSLSPLARALRKGIMRIQSALAQAIYVNDSPSDAGAVSIPGTLMTDSCTVDYDDRRGCEMRRYVGRLAVPVTEVEFAAGSYVKADGEWWAVVSESYGDDQRIYVCKRDEVVRSTANRGRAE